MSNPSSRPKGAGNVRPQRTGHQLERLAEASRVRAGVRHLVMRALVLDGLPAQYGADDLHVLTHLRDRLPPGLTVPALDDLRPGQTEAEQEAAAGHEVERR